ncbi:MFS transporter [Mycobacteroides abscessus]|uniref:Major facilitator superfamily n=7 Tax=Mycobacteroides abscessus TaxID=36809 RepID=B1MF25_MYCA9|nr:MFS transporter [Mycobacteroides abscessus]EUA62225.1 major Facilitator Superfamily protein [Mycobacteroides abscessus 1948]ALM17736.1 MFS transporter [Mycobacteroides abscessus]AMU46888.1 MFS transporter [Mycobacteroides abscessus]AMU51854.1 MFS transporter [Mycobacteroides abscessus]AMU56828.1 MFS transporter [Mycobacteroides abscessus]
MTEQLRAQPLSMMGVVGASIGNFLVAFDASAINVALPTATEELHATVDVGQWFLDGYTIPLCVFLLVSGAIGDRYGAVKVYRWSMLAFLAASVACAAADTAGTLIVARIAQGVGASFVVPMTLAILTKGIPDPRRRSTMIGAWGVVGGIGIASAPLLSGLITEYAGWRWLFLINVPICAFALRATRTIANIPADQPRRFNPISQLLLCVFLTCIASVLIEGRRLGWSSVSTLAMAGIAVLSMAALWQVERRSAEPTIPPALARNRSYLLIVCAGSFYQFASYGSLLVLALFLQVRHGLRADHAGYIMSICCVAWLLGNVLAVKVTPDNRRQAILAMAAVGCVGAVGTAALSLTEKIVPAMVPTSLIGVASGVLASSLSAAAMHVSPHTVSGVGSAVLNTSRQSGMVIAIALLGGLSFDHQLLVPMLLVASAFAMVLVTTALAFRPNLFKQSSAQRLQSSACQFPSRG